MTEHRRVAVVLAASQGLGRACAQALGASGAQLVICGRDATRLERTADELARSGCRALAVVADVTRPEQLEALFSRADTVGASLWTLVTNAGGPPPGNVLELEDAQWQAAFELTFMSAVRAIRLAATRMRASGGGRILVLGSSSVRQPIPGLAASNALRPALNGVVKTLAKELAPHRITVNMLSPGRIDTERVRFLDSEMARKNGTAEENVRAASQAAIPLGRYGSADEFAAVAAFLASDAASYVTGQSWLVDGGMVSALP